MRQLMIGLASVAITLLSPATSALAASDVAAPVYDPWEKANRVLYKINDGLDLRILRPAALGYKWALPVPVRDGVRNVISNVNEPNTLLNDLLQGRLDRGGVSAFRFLVNSTLGVAGLFEWRVR